MEPKNYRDELEALSKRPAFRPWDRDLEAGEDHIDTSIAEDVAEAAIEGSGLDDRPRCDPRTMAASYLDLRLLPESGAHARIADGVIWYPSDVPETWQAYLVGHEVGHELVRMESMIPACDWTVEAACAHLMRHRTNADVAPILEAVCSRIGRALLLPRVAFLRDVEATDGDLDALAALWPLAHRDVIAWRLRELRPSDVRGAEVQPAP